MDEKIVDAVWKKGIQVPDFNPDLIRKDCCGAWIMRDSFGNREDIYGWEIDHVFPCALGGGDEIDNLRPMQWQNNLAKADNYPSYESAIESNGNRNIEANGQYVVNSALQEKLRQLYSL